MTSVQKLRRCARDLEALPSSPPKGRPANQDAMVHTPMTKLPDDLIGVWRRVSLAIDGGPPSEDSRVVWIQGRARFADLRTPLEGASAGAGPMSFAGHASWEEPRLTFHRTIDLNEPMEDIGTLS